MSKGIVTKKVLSLPIRWLGEYLYTFVEYVKRLVKADWREAWREKNLKTADFFVSNLAKRAAARE